jgi:hypothetical protein
LASEIQISTLLSCFSTLKLADPRQTAAAVADLGETASFPISSMQDYLSRLTETNVPYARQAC